MKARDGLAIDIVRNPHAVVTGADIVCCATNANSPVFEGAWLEPGQMVISLVNSDVTLKRTEVDETTFARATDIVVNDWASVETNGQIELLDAIEKGLVDRARVVPKDTLFRKAATARPRAMPRMEFTINRLVMGDS